MSGLPLPDDARVTLTVAQLRAMVEGQMAKEFDGVGTMEAAKITGENPRTLRRLWQSWERIQNDGGRPTVRVSRKGSSGRSDLLFHRPDLARYMEMAGPTEEPEPDSPEDEGESGDEVDAIVDRLLSGD